MLRARTVAGPRTDAILLSDIGQDLDTDFAEAFIRVGRRIISDRVTVAQVLTNGFESLHLLLPGLRPIGLAPCTFRDAAKNAARYGVFIHFVGRYDVDGNAPVF